MYKTTVTSEEKIKAVEAYLGGTGSQKSWSEKFGVHHSTFQQWVRIYETFGQEGLMGKSKASRYSANTKQSAIEAYLSGTGSQSEICKRYGILSTTQLQNWIKLYNGHKELRSTSGSRSEIYMTKGRKTTREERIEIVAFCLENGKNYAKVIEKYGVSYQQIYAWVRKYEEHGVAGLTDKRGKRKAISEMTELERLRAENRLLQAQIKDKELEVALLKKLKELERRGY